MRRARTEGESVVPGGSGSEAGRFGVGLGGVIGAAETVVVGVVVVVEGASATPFEEREREIVKRLRLHWCCGHLIDSEKVVSNKENQRTQHHTTPCLCI